MGGRSGKVGRWAVVVVTILGFAFVVLGVIFGIVIGLSYLVEAIYR